MQIQEFLREFLSLQDRVKVGAVFRAMQHPQLWGRRACNWLQMSGENENLKKYIVHNNSAVLPHSIVLQEKC